MKKQDIRKKLVVGKSKKSDKVGNLKKYEVKKVGNKKK